MTGGQLANLTPYVPRLLLRWEDQYGLARHQAIDGTLVFADVSGFTRLSEALARKSGKAGAEEMADVINYLFGELLMLAAVRGGEMLKYGGDAMLLFFSGDTHAVRAAAACADMQRRLREIGRVDTGGAGIVRLRMSVGAHSGSFDFFVAGRHHAELLIAGPATTITVAMEAAADATQVLVSPAMARLLPARNVGAEKEGGFLLRGNPKAELVETQPLAPTRDPGRFLAAPLVRHLASDGTEPEHRLATVAFLQFFELDRLIDAGRADDAWARVDDVLTLVEESFLDFDVTFLATDVAADGGKVLAAAGAPITHGDDEERMLLACRRIVDASPALPVRVGVNRGHVFAGDVGPRFRRTYTTLGDVTNTAARVMGRAEAGQVLVLEPVLHAATSRWSSQPLEPFTAKGKSEPLVPWLVGDPRPRAVATAGTPLLGREHELRQLLDELTASRCEHRVVDMVAEPGLGKSRLLAEVMKLATDDGRSVHTVTGVPFASTSPYRLITTLAGSVLGPLDKASLQTIGARHGLEEELPLAGIAFGVDLPPTELTSALDAAVLPDAIARTAAKVIAAGVRDAAVLVVDDSHLSDPPSRGVLDALMHELAGRAVLICAARRDISEGWAPGEASLRLALLPLAAEAGLALVEAASTRPLLPEAASRLAERAAGNPLFALQLAASGADDLPESVEELIAARIDELPPTAKNALRQMAVLGPSFSTDVLAAVGGAEVPAALQGFVSVDNGTIRFDHALLQQTAYAGLSFRRRRELHRNVARVLLAMDARDDRVDELSHHCEAAGMWQETWRYAAAAARRAEGRYAFSIAALHWRRAAKAAVVAGSVESEKVADAWLACGEASRRAGQLADAEQAFRSGRRAAPSHSPIGVELAASIGRVHLLQGKLARANDWARRAHSELLRHGDVPFAIGATVDELRADIAGELGRPAEMIELARALVEGARSAGHVTVAARAQTLVHIAARRLDLAEEDAEGLLARELAEEAGNLRLVVAILSNLGHSSERRSDWRRATELYADASEAAARAGFALGRVVIDNNVAEILVQQGRLDDALPLFERSRTTASAAGHWHAAYLLANIGWVEGLRGDFAVAERNFAEAAAALEGLGVTPMVAEVDRRRVAVLLLRGDSDGALTHLRGPLAAAAETDPLLLAARSHALRQLGRDDEARVAAQRALAAALESSSLHGEFVAAEASTRLGERSLLPRLAELSEALGIIARPAVP